jgi:hypothetical protein
MKIKKPHFTNEFYSSTIGSYLVCQEKLKNTNIWKIKKMWKRFQEKDDLHHDEEYSRFIHWINVYFDIPEKDVPIVAVYSNATHNVIHCLFYEETLIPVTDTIPVATLVYPTKVWDLKGNEIDFYKWRDWRGNEHNSKEAHDNVVEEKRT